MSEEIPNFIFDALFDPFDDPIDSSKIEADTEIQKFIDDQKKPSTVRSTKFAMAILSTWLKDVKQFDIAITDIAELPPSILDGYLCEFFIQLKKKDGSDYETTSIDSIKAGIERHLKDNFYPYSLMADREFSRLRDVIKSKKVILKKEGLGRKANAAMPLDKADEEKIKETGELSPDYPRSLQLAMFINFGKGFGLRGRDEHRNLRFGDVTVNTTSDGKKYLEMRERNSKTMDGSKNNDYRKTRPRIFSTDGSATDPVNIFQKFSSKRPAEAMAEDSPMYLTPKPAARLDLTSPWYYKTPMGKNTLGELIKKACLKAGVEGKKTNHSIRKRSIKDLSAAGVPPHKIIQITGHKNTASIQDYDNFLEIEEHENIQAIQFNQVNHQQLTTRPAPAETAARSLSQSLSVSVNRIGSESPVSTEQDIMHQLFKGGQFKDCVFNITVNNSHTK